MSTTDVIHCGYTGFLIRRQHLSVRFVSAQATQRFAQKYFSKEGYKMVFKM